MESDIAQRERQEQVQFARRLGRVLQIGIVAAGAVIVMGLILAAADRPGTPGSLDTALGRDDDFQVSMIRPRALFDGVLDGRADAWIELGVVILILIPTVRVALTGWMFLRQRDRILAEMAGFVLVILLLGFVGIGA